MTEKLRTYAEKTKEYAKKNGLAESEAESWIFGAADFALSASLITKEDFEKLMQEYCIY